MRCGPRPPCAAAASLAHSSAGPMRAHPLRSERRGLIRWPLVPHLAGKLPGSTALNSHGLIRHHATLSACSGGNRMIAPSSPNTFVHSPLLAPDALGSAQYEAGEQQLHTCLS
jgi:hypothetical protein